MFWQPVVAMADGIVVNGSGTTLGQAGNGVPIVNIATPNGSGLSHNKFSDYNVGQQGLILNNANGRTQETLLGGIILGNSNLGGRAANVILNEVNGGSPSQLKGYTEVAGQSAHVIVANPYGVSCNGCGFINTPKATLTTGKPVIENGQVQRYQVDQGSVAIEGAGLNASNIDQFEIITRSAKINAEIQARHLAVIAGANDVDAKTLNATARTANPADAPQLAIDSSALGGMYAGAIKLVGTEAGVGVKLDGKLIASGGDIQLDANGQLRMADATAEKGAVAIKAGSLEAQGAVYAGSELKVQTRGDLNNHSTLAAANSINLGSGGQLNNQGIIEAGVNLDNSRNPNGDVTLTAQTLNNSGKSVVASRDLTVTTTQTLNNQGGTLSGQRQVTVSAGALDNSHQGKLLSAERLQLDAEQVRNGQGGLIKSQQSLNATLGHLGNSGGELSSQGSSTLVLAGMDNLTGVVLAQQTLEITGTAELDNQGGLLSGWQGLTLNGTGLNNSNKGTVSSLKGGVEVTLSDALNNSQGGALVSQQALDVKAASLDNSLKGMISSAGAQSLKISDRLDNSQGGSIDSAATLTLQAMALGNQSGIVNAAGDLEFIGSDLDNSHGTFTGKQGVTLDLLGHLINNQGTLSAAGPLLLKRSTKVENQGGELSSQQWLRLFTEHLDNRQKGRVAANESVLINASGEVQNSDGGEILSREADLQLNAERLDSAKGLLQAKTNLGLDVAADAGNQGGQVIAQQGDLTLKAGHLDNRAGKVSALNGGATLETAADGRLDNRDGALFAQQALHISAKDLDNSAGQISARQIELELAGALDNRQGLIESGSTLATAAASLDNQRGQLRALGLASKTRFSIAGTFDNRDGSLETANNDLAFDAGGFNNRGGSLLHSGSGVFGISMANLEDVGGRLKTAGQLTLEAERWTNSSAIQADRLLVKVDHLTQTADGQLLAGTGLTGSGSHWSNDGLIGSDAALNLDLNGSYSGKGRLSSIGQLDLHAAQLDLADSASIAGGANGTLKIDGALNSAGRITASQKLLLNAASIHNLGTLGSGEDLSLNAAILVNDHGLISSGGNMQLLTNSFTNRYAQVFSLGTALIAKDDQQARADLLDNRSGDIESLGKLTIAASTLNNVMDVLQYTEHEKSAASITRLSCTLIPVAGCDDRGGGRINGLWEVAETDRLRVTNSSAAASLNSGADLQIDTQTLTNTSSLITAAGDINIKAETVHNQGLQPQEITTLRRYWSFVNETGTAAALAAAFNARNNPTPSSSFASDLSAFITWTGVMLSSSSKVVDGDQSFAATIQAGGKVNLKADQTLDNSVIRSFYEYVGAGKTLTDTGVGNGYSTPIRINPQLPPELAQQQVNPLELPGFTLPTGGNGLFRLSGQGSTLAQAPIPAQIAGLPDAASLSRPHKYLIETNPALTHLKQFMSSDYLLSNLGYNPDESAKRLGDGFYEQKLIQQAMVARTGQRFIDGQDSNEKLFKHLMDNALQSKQQLDLSVGVTLTSEQVAALTHDIVWLESHEVNGEQVLVPVLYLAQANNRLAPNGSLIAGKDVSLIAGKDLNNVGTLRAANDLSAVAGANLVNSGLAEAGNRQDLLAGDYLVNRAGGIIAGRDVTLTTTQGDVINDRTLTTHQSSSAAYVREQRRDFLDSAARIEAGNSLSIDAERDFDSNGSVLHSGGDTRIKGGRNVSLNAVEQVVSNDRGIGNLDQSKTQHGATLESGGDLSIEAGGNVTAVASQIDAEGDVSMTAKDYLTLASAANEQHWASKTGTTKSEEDRVHQQATTVTAGGDVMLKAGQDMTLISSKVKAGDEAYLVAGGELNLLAEQDSEHSLYDMKKKGGWGSKETKRDEVTRVTHVGSEISAGGNLTLKSDGDQRYQVAKLESGKDLTLESGGAITFEGVKDLLQESHEQSKGDLAWTSSKGKGNTDETLRQSQLMAKGELIIKAADGLKIDIKQIDQKSISQTIDAMVQADPQLAWLKEAEKRGDVDWRRVKELHDSWDYSHSGLGVGAQLVIMILVSYLTAGFASGLVATGAAQGSAMAAATTTTATVGGVTTTTTVAAGWGNVMASSILSSMAGSAAVSTVNNKGNLGAVFKDITSKDALKGYATGAVTAGFTAGVLDSAFGVTGDNVNKVTKGFDLGSVKDLGKFGAYLGAQGVVQAGAQSVIQGGSFSENLSKSLTAQGQHLLQAGVFNWVGDVSDKYDWKEGSVEKIAFHALVGGALSKATGGDFATGAAAAGASEALITRLSGLIGNDKNLELMVSQLIGISAAAAVNGDVAKGAEIAKNATAYNRQLHPEERKRIQQQAKVLADEQKISVAEAERRLAEAFAFYTDKAWQTKLSRSGVVFADSTLAHLGQALAPLGAFYDTPTEVVGDIPVAPGPGKTYTPSETLAMLKNYEFTHADFFSPMVNLEYITDKEQRDYYKNNLDYRQFDILAEGSGAAKGIGGALKGSAEDIYGFGKGLLLDTANTANGVTHGLIRAASNPQEVIAAFNSAKQDAENLAFLYELQGNPGAALEVRMKWATEFALNFAVINRAGKLGKVANSLRDQELATQGAAAGATGSKLISQSEAKLAGYKPCCFAAGTMVATPKGERAIETLKIGDVVWSKPEQGGEPFAAAITATHVRTDQPIYRLGLRKDSVDGVASSETLEVTPGHPFYVPARKGFVPLIELQPGDRLQSLGDGAGESSSITVGSVELLQPQGRTYNLTVDIGHTFYVGKLGTWVHNVGPCYSCSNGSCSIHEAVPEISAATKIEMQELQSLRQSAAGKKADFLINERAAAAELKALEASINDAHFVSRHGPETTLIQQELRAKTGMTPDNQSKRPIDASRWASYQDMSEAFQKAQAIYRKTGQTSVTVDLGRVIGEGYLKGGGSYVQTTKAVVRFDINGKPYTAYPKLR
ncbi:filamentous hemagglutinin family protein, intein-containing [Pseudomonas protegens Pf-5]|nr:filamentous hemagglutinin family protein, intein-containing [Pseudomonas protegens Pf-5]